MITHIRLNIFSGRPDPEWTLKDDDARKLAAAVARLPVSHAEPPKQKPRLGYNGFTITAINDGTVVQWQLYQGWLQESGGVRRIDENRKLEQAVYQSAPAQVLETVQRMSFSMLTTVGNEVTIAGLNPPGKTGSATCVNGPALPSAKDWTTHTNYNNCYNYANDVLNTDQWSSSALPGTMNNMPASTVTSTVKSILRTQIKKDDLALVSGDKVPTTCPAANRHYLAIILRHHPASTQVMDFHCLRLDTDGTWSHKAGSKLPRNTDDAGAGSTGDVITDLRKARFDGNPVLVGVYRAKKNNLKIK